MNIATKMTLAGLLASMAALAPPGAQLCIALACLALLIWGAASSPVSESAGDPAAKDPAGAATKRFGDALQSVELLGALDEFDVQTKRDFEKSLDRCICGYVKLLNAADARERVRTNTLLDSHIVHREAVRERLREAAVSAGSARAQSAVDEASERVGSLFSSFDRVIHGLGIAPVGVGWTPVFA